MMPDVELGPEGYLLPCWLDVLKGRVQLSRQISGTKRSATHYGAGVRYYVFEYTASEFSNAMKLIQNAVSQRLEALVVHRGRFDSAERLIGSISISFAIKASVER